MSLAGAASRRYSRLPMAVESELEGQPFTGSVSSQRAMKAMCCR
jgi:hypothetical protein